MDTNRTASPRPARLPRPARILVALVAAAGAGCLAARLPEVLRWQRGDLLACAALALATVVAEQFPVSLPHRTEHEDFALTDAVWAAGLVLAKPGVLTVAAVAGTAMGQGLRKVAPIKVAFNAGQFALALTVAEVLTGAFHRPGALNPPDLAAVAGGMACFLVVNTGLLAEVIALVEGVGFLGVLRSPAFLNVAHWAGNLLTGLLAARLWLSHPWTTPLAALPLALAYLAYRAWMREFLRLRPRVGGPAVAVTLRAPEAG